MIFNYTILTKTFFLIILFSSLKGFASVPLSPPKNLRFVDTEQKIFKIFDGTLYKNKPSFNDIHFFPITNVYEGSLFTANQAISEMPLESRVRSAINPLRGSKNPVVLDIERWPITGDETTIKTTADKMRTVLLWAKNEAPGVSFGYYGSVPARDYWRAIKGPLSAEYKAWQLNNDYLEAMSNEVDAAYPSLYTFYTDQKGWVAYAIANINEARRKAIGKPVYVYLWPQYHDSNVTLAGTFLPVDYWELELNTAYEHADGIVIWGGWGIGGPMPWDENAPWWQATKRFIENHNI